MPSTHDPIRGIPLTDKPAETSRCGMSNASLAQHRTSKKWYKLSIGGKILGSPLEFDFYRHNVDQEPKTQSTVKTKELSKVS